MTRSSRTVAIALACAAAAACGDKVSPVAVVTPASLLNLNGLVVVAPDTSAAAATTPLANVAVSYQSCPGTIVPIDTGGYYVTSNCSPAGSVVSDAAGTFSVHSLAPGSYVFKATPPAGSNYHRGQVQYIAVSVPVATTDQIKIKFIQ